MLLSETAYIHHVILTVTWIITEALDRCLIGIGGLLVEVDPIDQALMGHPFADLSDYHHESK